jgi:hypothetical protein
MVLACSRHMFVRPVIRMDQESWTRAHVEAFTFFGGVAARLVPDNLKTGVDKPDLYDPKINRSYGELAVHYGTLIDPARAFKPRDKPRVERPMPYVRDSFWRGRDFTSVEEMQTAAVTWCRQVAGVRSHSGLGGARPESVFEAVEKAALIPLPRTRFTVATWSTGKVGPDIHVKVGPVLYSVPWRLIGQRVSARSTATTVQIIHDQQVVATHLRGVKGRRTNYDHYPPERIAFQQRTPVWCRATARGVGPGCVAVVNGLLEVNALYRLRSAQGVLRLRETHTPARLEAACLKALSVGDPSYRTVKGILVAALENTPAPPTAGDGGAAAFLHGPDRLFADVIPLPTRPATGGGGTPPPEGDPAQPADTLPLDAPVDVLPFDVPPVVATARDQARS